MAEEGLLSCMSGQGSLQQTALKQAVFITDEKYLIYTIELFYEKKKVQTLLNSH